MEELGVRTSNPPVTTAGEMTVEIENDGANTVDVAVATVTVTFDDVAIEGPNA